MKRTLWITLALLIAIASIGAISTSGSIANVLRWLDGSANEMMRLTDAGTTGNLLVSGTVTATGGIAGAVNPTSLNVGSAASGADDNETVVGMADAGSFAVQAPTLHITGAASIGATSGGLNIGGTGSAADNDEICVGIADAGSYSVQGVTEYLSGDLTLAGGDIIANTATTWNLLNTVATTLNVGGAATAVNIGAATGTATIANATTGVVALTATGSASVGTTSGGVNVGSTASAADNAEVCVGMADAGAYAVQAPTLWITGAGAVGSTSGGLNVGSTGALADNNEACIGISDVGDFTLQSVTMYLSDTAQVNGMITSGLSDTNAGTIMSYGNGTTTGGKIQIGMGANQDTTVDYWELWAGGVAGEYLQIGWPGNPNLYLDVASGVKVGTGLAVGTSASLSDADDNEVVIGMADAGAYALQAPSAYITGALTLAQSTGGNSLVVDTTGLVYDSTNNRFGIGLAAPETDAQVKDTSTTGAAQIRASNDNGDDLDSLIYGSAATSTTFGVARASLSVIATNAGPLAIGTNNTAQALYFGTNSTKRLTLGAAGECELVGKVTNYNSIATVNNGVSSLIASTSATNQTAAISASTIYAVPASGQGMYRVSWSAMINTAASTSSILGGATGFQLTYTDPADNVVKTSNPTTVTSSAANTTATAISGTFNAFCKLSTNLQYSFGYTSVGATPMAYCIYVYVECLG